MGTSANFRVFQASAGAGKTFTLIKEYLKLCLANERSVANFRHILAITFTNAAANEMKAKIMSALGEIIDSKEVKPNTMEAVLMQELAISDEQLKRNAQRLMTCIMQHHRCIRSETVAQFCPRFGPAKPIYGQHRYGRGGGNNY